MISLHALATDEESDTIECVVKSGLTFRYGNHDDGNGDDQNVNEALSFVIRRSTNVRQEASQNRI